jgi:hypothetical protein
MSGDLALGAGPPRTTSGLLMATIISPVVTDPRMVTCGVKAPRARAYNWPLDRLRRHSTPQPPDVAHSRRR